MKSKITGKYTDLKYCASKKAMKYAVAGAG
jgi:hypothetical protein